nr:hypothetical protein [Tanacetum cinerariifolium]
RAQNVGNQNGLIGVQGNGNQNQIGNGNLVAARAEGNATGQNGNQIRCYNCMGEEARIQLQAEEYDLMAAAADLDEIEENDNDVISEDTSVEQGGEAVEQHPVNFEETRASYESLYQNLAIEVEKVNSVNRKLKETNADMTTELARYKNQERCFEISQEKYDKLERMTIETHNWASSAHQELYKIVREENFPIVNQVDARLQNFKIQFLKEAAKFIGDFKSLTNEADASLAKHKALELKIERLLKAVVSQDIMIIMQNKSVVDTSDLQTKLECIKERFKNCIIKKETGYAKLWNDWYKKCDECNTTKFRTLKLTRTCNKRSNCCKLS